MCSFIYQNKRSQIPDQWHDRKAAFAKVDGYCRGKVPFWARWREGLAVSDIISMAVEAISLSAPGCRCSSLRVIYGERTAHTPSVVGGRFSASKEDVDGGMLR